MTTIAANRKVMAADSRCSAGGVWFQTKKIERKGDALIGACGKASDCSKFMEWYGSGNPVPEITEGEFEALVLTPKGLFLYQWDCSPMQLKDRHYAIGSGQQGALVALDKGDEPKQAVEAACKRDLFSGGPIDVYLLKGQ